MKLVRNEYTIGKHQTMVDTQHAINEARGISDIVKEATEMLVKKLEYYIKHGKRHMLNNGIIYSSYKGKEHIINNDIKLRIICYYINQNQEQMIDLESFYDDDEVLIQISCLKINGKIVYDNLIDTIYHEMLHYYQHITKNGGHVYPIDVNKNDIVIMDNEFYNYVSNMFHSNDKFEHLIGFVLYLSHKHEQEAYAHGLYGFMKQNAHIPWRKAYEKSDMYNAIENCSFLIGKITDGVGKAILLSNGVYGLEKLFNITYDKLINICNDTRRELIRKAGRAISLVIDEQEEKQKIKNNGNK